MTTKSIATVGARFSGTLPSLHLLRHCPPGTRVVLIERLAGPQPGGGAGRPPRVRRPGAHGRVPRRRFERVRRLLADGTVRPDPLRLGLDVTGTCALLHGDGAISRRLFVVGPVTKAAFWEMTAVSDIRRQCELLAQHLAGLVKAMPPAPAPAEVLDVAI